MASLQTTASAIAVLAFTSGCAAARPTAHRVEVEGAALPARSALRVHWEAMPGVSSAHLQDAAEEFTRGVMALPAGLHAFPGGPLTVRVHPDPSDFGMGSTGGGRPLWDDGQRVFNLYAYREPDEPRALARLGRLTQAERERLWRRRAGVHAVLARWERVLRWSSRSEWRRITGWQEAPSNPYAWAYSRLLGMQSATLDLLTFFEEALISPAALRHGAVDVNESLECQEFAKLRFLRRALQRFEPAQSRASTGRAQCPAFEAFADFPHLSHVEVMLSSPSGLRPQSLFGHLLLRPVYTDDAVRSVQPVIEVAALISPVDDALTFGVKGLTGGYPNIWKTTSLGTIRMEANDQDQRTLRRFRLNLTRQETERVMERLWELERRGYHRYFFFSDNCASFVAFVINGAVDEQRVVPLSSLLVLPTGVLDAMARVEGVDAEGRAAPLLTEEAGPFESHRVRAVEAERALRRAVSELGALVPVVAKRWQRYEAAVRSSERRIRSGAHATLSALVSDTLATSGDPRASALCGVISEQTVVLERYPAQIAEEALRALELARIVIPKGTWLPSSKDLARTRQVRFQKEGREDRIFESIREYVRLAEVLDSMPRRPLTARELAVRTDAYAQRQAFVQVAAAHGHILDDLEGGPQESPPSPPPQSGGQRPASLRFSGLGRFALGVAGAAPANSAFAAVLVRTAFLRELLGEQRPLGLDALTELRLMDAEIWWAAPAGFPEPVRAEVTVLSFLVVPREPAVTRTSLLDAVGYAVDATLSQRGARAASLRLTLRGDVVWPVASSPDYSRHLLVTAGALAEANGTPLPVAAGAGPRVGVAARFQAPGARYAALRVSSHWAAVHSTAQPHTAFTHRVAAKAAFEWEVSVGSGLLVEAALAAEVPVGSPPSSSSDLVGSLAVEWP